MRLRLFTDRCNLARLLFLASLCLLFVVIALWGAHAPSDRQRRPASLQDSLSGEWVMRWGGTPYYLTLEKGGGYSCKLGSIEYVGSWSVDGQGRFRIIESTRPEDANSWRSYCIVFGQGTFAGQEEGSKVEVRLTRP